MLLPTEKTQPRTDLEDLTVLLYGAPKFGKSTWASQAPGALFLATEPGLNHLAVHQIPISTWEEMGEACALIAAGQHDFRTVVIDTVDNAFLYCERWMCQRNGWNHPSDAPYGKGFSMVKAEFLRVLTKLANMPYGLIMTSHSKQKEVKTATGTIQQTVPTLTGSALDVSAGLADLFLFGDMEESQVELGAPILCRRVARTKPTMAWQAGDRTGRMPETIDFSWTALEAAWNEAMASHQANLPTRKASRTTTKAA